MDQSLATSKTNASSKGHSKGNRAALGLITACWGMATVVGLAMLWRHGLVAGQVATTQQTWPAAVLLPKPSDGCTLIMTVHPQCPCSRASINELQVLMSRCPRQLHASVLFVEPAGVNGPAEATALWKSASQIPGVKTIVDNDGVMTRQFGAHTSGQVFLYDAAGVLRFSGGMTASRGHEGDNDGLTTIEAIVCAQKTGVTNTPIYGCRIW